MLRRLARVHFNQPLGKETQQHAKLTIIRHLPSRQYVSIDNSIENVNKFAALKTSLSLEIISGQATKVFEITKSIWIIGM